jgi:hypothetical protein
MIVAGLVVLFTAALAALAPGVGLAASIVVAALLATMLTSGRVFCRALGTGEDPFLALVVGFVLLSHALLLADFFAPGAHWQVAAALAVVGLPGWRTDARLPLRPVAGLGLLIAAFTFAWCADVAPRLAHFRATGEFDFWVDALVHAGTLAQFADPKAIGRGMVILADMPNSLYHFASYLPAALLARVTSTPVLDVTLLFWIPFGMLVMACGVVALGLELGGPAVAGVALMAVALVPDPARLSLGNGLLDFAWLIETSPGTPYSVGVACAAIAALVRWARDQRPAALALSVGLTAGCFLVRANTFLWLAPAIAIGVVVGWRGVNARLRFVAAALGLIGLAAVFAALSWRGLRENPAQFLFGYVEFVNQGNAPTYVDGLYSKLIVRLGRAGAGAVGTILTLFGTLGPWLPALFISAIVARRRQRLEAIDALPFVLLIVAAIEILMAPTARNGDLTEFRHRASPLLVIVTLIWTLHFAAIAAATVRERLSLGWRRVGLAGLAVLSLGTLALSIGTLKRPRMAWGATGYYGTRVAPELAAVAPLLAVGDGAKLRFAVAGQPLEAHIIDDAARLVGLSGVPAYVSCPAYLMTLGGPVGEETRRRMAVVRRLAEAPNLESLQDVMRAEGITAYVVTSARDLAFDPERRGAIGRAGDYAVYLASPNSVRN